MNWAHVDTDGSTIEYDSLPVNWKNISNFFAIESDVDRLASLGWYKLVDITTPITNDFIEYHGAPEYSLDINDKTIKKKCPIIVRDVPVVAQSSLTIDEREIFFGALRAERNRRLQNSDWTQAVDLQAIKSDTWKQLWVNYRQSLRDLPEKYLFGPYNIDLVVWPEIFEST